MDRQDNTSEEFSHTTENNSVVSVKVNTANEYSQEGEYDEPMEEAGHHSLEEPTPVPLTNTFMSILEKLQDDTDSVQQSALRDLSHMLADGTNENCDGFGRLNLAKELVRIIEGPSSPDQATSGNPETMVLACQCIANLIDSDPTDITVVISQNVVQALCRKLMSVEHIDLAEQALCVLEKISAQSPGAVVKENGLSVMLLHFNLLSLRAKRVALKAVANCLSDDQDNILLSQVLEIRPALLDGVASLDSFTVKNACLCWALIAEKCQNNRDQMERVTSTELTRRLVGHLSLGNDLRAIRDILRIFNQMSSTSSQLGFEMLQLGVIESIFRYLHIADDKMAQSIIVVIFKILPGPLNPNSYSIEQDSQATWFQPSSEMLLNICRLLLPAIPKLYSKYLDQCFRETVLHVSVKLVYPINADSLLEVMGKIPMSEFLCSIIILKEHPTFILRALELANILLEKSRSAYQNSFEREGLFYEVDALSKFDFYSNGLSSTYYDRDRLLLIDKWEHVIECVQKLKKKYAWSVKGDIFLNMMGIARDLEVEQHQESAIKGLEHCLQCHNVSGYELHHSGLLKTLSKQEDHVRMLNKRALRELAISAHAVLSRMSNFRVMTAPRSSRMVTASSRPFSRPLYITLVADNAQKTVAVNPITTFEYIESFILSHFRAELLQSSEGKWRVQFSMDGNRIPIKSTTFAAAYRFGKNMADLWDVPHLVDCQPVFVEEGQEFGLDNYEPEVWKPMPVVSDAIRLLKAISVAAGRKTTHDKRLIACVKRQLNEPMLVTCKCLPSWLYYLMEEAPFLFPFELRLMFLQNTVSSYQRLAIKFDPRGNFVKQIEIHIEHEGMIESAAKTLSEELEGDGRILGMQPVSEDGTGKGPMPEFFASVSEELRKQTWLWRDGRLLFPKTLTKSAQREAVPWFKALGQHLAKGILDSGIIDIPFSIAFLKIAFEGAQPSLELLKRVDSKLFKSLITIQEFVKQKQNILNNQTMSLDEKDEALLCIEVQGTRIEDLCLNFTLPGAPECQLKENGSEVSVIMSNVEEYLDLTLDMLLGSGISKQCEALKQGFSEIMPMEQMKIFRPSELVMYFGRAKEDWSYATLSSAIRADNGYTMESVTVKRLLTILSKLGLKQRRSFLKFATGAPRLPVGGWKSLSPKFTIARKLPEENWTADDTLPSVVTFTNYLEMPEYTTLKVMFKKLESAMLEKKIVF